MKGSRRKSRILAFQAVYSWDFNNEQTDILSSFTWLDKDKLKQETELFASLLLNGTIENINIIDETIKKHIDNWNFERISKVDLAILRISVY